MPGSATLEAEVTHVSRHGFWLLLGDEELSVPFSEFPWFKQATIEQLSDVQRPAVNHLYWPQLDIDLADTLVVPAHRVNHLPLEVA